MVDDSVSAEALASMLYFRPICEDHFAVAMSSNHRLAGETSLSITSLAGESWAINRTAQTYRTQIMNACQDVGFTPRVVASCRNISATLEMVRTGYVVTVLPALALRAIAADPAFAVVPVEPIMVRRIFAAMVQGTFRRPAVGVVLKALNTVAPQFVFPRATSVTP